MTGAPAPGSRGSSPGSSSALSVVLAGGGSAGHVSPMLAVADALRRRDPGARITCLGTAAGLEQRLVPARGYDLRAIPKVIFPRRPSAAVLRLPSALTGAVRAAGEVLDEVGADVVVGFGGYVSSPAFLAARRRGIPIVVHEANARAGLANRLGARLTAYVATTFSVTRLPHARLTGMPLRPEITGLHGPARTALRPQALAHYGLADHRPTLLVTGGSLGAARLNGAFADAVDLLLAEGVQVLHVTGLGKEFEVPAAVGAGQGGGPGAGPGGARYVVVPYADRMDLAYAAADLVVTRAGANMVCELTAVGLPGVYVPLPIGNGEQRVNAADVVAAGGGVVIDDGAVTREWVRSFVVPLALDASRLAAMATAAAGIGHRDGDERVTDLVLEAAAGGRP